MLKIVNRGLREIFITSETGERRLTDSEVTFGDGIYKVIYVNAAGERVTADRNSTPSSDWVSLAELNDRQT